MVVGTGLGGNAAAAAESTYGTYPGGGVDHHYKVRSFGLKKRKGTFQGWGLASGQLVPDGSRRGVAFQDAGGPLVLEVTNKNMGLLFQQAFGALTGPTQQGATPAYLQSHTIGDVTGKMLSIQGAVPDTSGTARPFTFLGSKLISAEFSCSQGSENGILLATFEFDSRQASEVQTVVAASYLTGVRPFNFAQMGVKLGTYNSEAAVNGIKGMSLKIERASDVERFYANNAGLKDQPLANDMVKVSGAFQSDFVDKTILSDRFAADSSTSLVWEFIGNQISGSYYETCRFRVPMLFLDGDTPGLDGPGVVSGSFPFVGLYDGTNAAAACDYISTDTAI